MTDNTQPEALRLAEQYDYGDPVAHSNMWKAAVCTELRRQHARIAELESRVQELGAMARENRSRRIVELEAQLDAIRAGGVSGPLMGKPQEMPDISALTERGAQAWAGVDAQGLRDGVASAGSEPVATVFTMEALAPGGGVKYHATVHKPLPDGTKLYLHPSPPGGMVGGWIASKDQMPPPGVRVFWGDVDSNRVGYDFWAGEDYRWAPSHWMRIPEFPAPPTSSADSRKGE